MCDERKGSHWRVSGSVGVMGGRECVMHVSPARSGVC